MTERIYEKTDSILLTPKEHIVRCKDCKHIYLKDFIRGTCKYRTGEVLPEGYCDKGEEK